MLEAEQRALSIWIANRQADVRRIARDAQVRDHVEALVRIASRPGGSPAEYCGTPARRALVDQLSASLEEQGAVAFNVIDGAGRIVASRRRENCGLRIERAAFERDIAAVFRGETRFVAPYREVQRLERSAAAAPFERPLIWFETPVRSAAGGIVAALAFGEPADGQFAGILSAARTGESGEAYAYDQRGVVLAGARSAEGGSTTLVARFPEQDRAGVALEPYPGYHGRPVIGAWRWLPEHDLGIAVEIGESEAYAPLRYLQITFGAVFAAMVLALAAALAGGWSVLRLKREMGTGRRLGAYRLERQVGSGGMANVYLARHELLKRPTAVKLLKPAVATDEMTARFEREVQLASRLTHPNTVEIFDYGRTRDGLFYYAMEFLDGLTVSQVLASSTPPLMPTARAIHILRQVCAALAEAHALGLVHRDIKPENVMVCRYGGAFDFVKILDFGLVKSIRAPHSRDLTRSLRILGTPLYMAPERLRNPADVDARADIYAVGALGYLMLTGRRLFESSDDLELTSKILNDEPPRPSSIAPQPLPEELDLIIVSCVEKKRENRPQRIVDLVEAFDALAADYRWTQREAEAWWTSSAPNTDLAKT